MKRLLHSVALIALLMSVAMSAMAQTSLPGDSMYQVQAAMTDQTGRTLAWQELRGRPTVLSMFYANCHLVCPLIITNAKALQRQLPPGSRDALGLAMISIDPARDTPEALADVARQHRLDPGHWRLLRPRDRDLRTLAAALGVRYRALPGGSFNHSSVLILLDRDGREVARTRVDGPQPDPVFVAAVRNHLARRD